MRAITGLTIPKFVEIPLFAAAACGCVLLYLHIAGIQFNVNKDMTRADQSAYMDFVRRAHESDLTYTGGRNRMPLFPWIMTLVYAPDMTDKELFDAGKQMNVWLSVLILLVMGATFFARFSRLYAAYASLAIAFLVFVLKSPYFQAELLFYGLFALAFVLALSNLSRPAWRKSLVAGLLFGLAHFTKASVLPAFLIYLGSFGVLAFIQLFRRDPGRRHIGRPAMLFSCLFSPFLPFCSPICRKAGKSTEATSTMSIQHSTSGTIPGTKPAPGRRPPGTGRATLICPRKKYREWANI